MMTLSDEPTYTFGPGAILASRYRIERPIGSGGLGHVFEAFDLRVHRRCALKLLRPDRRDKPLARQRFQREGSLGASLSHHNLAQVYDAGSSDEGPYIVMELIEGCSLDELLSDRQPLALTTTLAITEGLVRALHVLAQQGIVHGDVKPANIMISYNPLGVMRTVLVDLGLAYSRHNPALGPLASDHHIVSGTPRYFAPEQALGQLPTPTSDLYSAGCVLYEMLTGRPPFGEKDATSLMVAHAHRPALAPRARFSNLTHPHTLELLLMHMLDKDPDMRPGHDDIRRVLETIHHML